MSVTVGGNTAASSQAQGSQESAQPAKTSWALKDLLAESMKASKAAPVVQRTQHNKQQDPKEKEAKEIKMSEPIVKSAERNKSTEDSDNERSEAEQASEDDYINPRAPAPAGNEYQSEISDSELHSEPIINNLAQKGSPPHDRIESDSELDSIVNALSGPVSSYGDSDRMDRQQCELSPKVDERSDSELPTAPANDSRKHLVSDVVEVVPFDASNNSQFNIDHNKQDMMNKVDKDNSSANTTLSTNRSDSIAITRPGEKDRTDRDKEKKRKDKESRHHHHHHHHHHHRKDKKDKDKHRDKQLSTSSFSASSSTYQQQQSHSAAGSDCRDNQPSIAAAAAALKERDPQQQPRLSAATAVVSVSGTSSSSSKAVFEADDSKLSTSEDVRADEDTVEEARRLEEELLAPGSAETSNTFEADLSKKDDKSIEERHFEEEAAKETKRLEEEMFSSRDDAWQEGYDKEKDDSPLGIGHDKDGVPGSYELDSERKMEDDLAVSALLQEMGDENDIAIVKDHPPVEEDPEYLVDQTQQDQDHDQSPSADEPVTLEQSPRVGSDAHFVVQDEESSGSLQIDTTEQDNVVNQEASPATPTPIRASSSLGGQDKPVLAFHEALASLQEPHGQQAPVHSHQHQREHAREQQTSSTTSISQCSKSPRDALIENHSQDRPLTPCIDLHSSPPLHSHSDIDKISSLGRTALPDKPLKDKEIDLSSSSCSLINQSSSKLLVPPPVSPTVANPAIHSQAEDLFDALQAETKARTPEPPTLSHQNNLYQVQLSQYPIAAVSCKSPIQSLLAGSADDRLAAGDSLSSSPTKIKTPSPAKSDSSKLEIMESPLHEPDDKEVSSAQQTPENNNSSSDNAVNKEQPKELDAAEERANKDKDDTNDSSSKDDDFHESHSTPILEIIENLSSPVVHAKDDKDDIEAPDTPEGTPAEAPPDDMPSEYEHTEVEEQPEEEDRDERGDDREERERRPAPQLRGKRGKRGGRGGRGRSGARQSQNQTHEVAANTTVEPKRRGGRATSVEKLRRGLRSEDSAATAAQQQQQEAVANDAKAADTPEMAVTSQLQSQKQQDQAADSSSAGTAADRTALDRLTTTASVSTSAATAVAATAATPASVTEDERPQQQNKGRPTRAGRGKKNKQSQDNDQVASVVTAPLLSTATTITTTTSASVAAVAAVTTMATSASAEEFRSGVTSSETTSTNKTEKPCFNRDAGLKRPATSSFDVYEFKDSDDDEDPFSALPANHEQQQAAPTAVNTSVVGEKVADNNKIIDGIREKQDKLDKTLGGKEATPAVSSTDEKEIKERRSSDEKEYVAEPSQHGKISLTIRLHKDGHDRAEVVKSSEPIDEVKPSAPKPSAPVVHEETSQSSGKTRKSARLAGKNTVDDTIDEVIGGMPAVEIESLPTTRSGRPRRGVTRKEPEDNTMAQTASVQESSKEKENNEVEVPEPAPQPTQTPKSNRRGT